MPLSTSPFDISTSGTATSGTATSGTATSGTAQPAGATFASLGLPQRLVTALERRGIREPFPIQTLTLPDALAGRDVLGRGETGSGKTLAFGLPLLTRLSQTRPANGAPRGLVLVPTRELAGQVRDQLEPLGHALGLKTVAVFGGAPMGRQIAALRKGVDVVVATPGRLQDLVDQRECDLTKVEITVLDEADFMADLGFLPAVTKLLQLTKADGQRLLFSATLDNAVDRLVRRFLDNPVTHAIASAAAPVTTMEHLSFAVRAEDKVAVIAEVASRPARTLLFVRTKHGADRLAKQLSRLGVAAGAIHGNLNQNQRQRALDGFMSGRARVLVATDVAARGIHVDDVDLVVHVDLPADHKDYLHRSGRTARAGASGTVLSLLPPGGRRDAERLWQRAGVKVTVTDVRPGHPAVQEVATSGTPVVVREPAPVAADVRGGSRSQGAPRSGGAAGTARSGGAAGSRPSRRRRRPAGRTADRAA